VHAKTLEILATSFSNGKKHDFRLYKESKVLIPSTTKVGADSGYQGIAHIHSNSVIPHKGTKKKPLTKDQKKFNHQHSSKRIHVEHVIGKVKVFKILSERYRNRRKRFGLRFNLIAGIYNFELRGGF
jgi:hypothetical protein